MFLCTTFCQAFGRYLSKYFQLTLFFLQYFPTSLFVHLSAAYKTASMLSDFKITKHPVYIRFQLLLHSGILIHCQFRSGYATEPGNTGIDITGQFIIEPSGQVTYFLHADKSVSIPADQGDFIPFCRVRNIRDLDHELVHADPAPDGRFLPADQDIAFIAQAPGPT